MIRRPALAIILLAAALSLVSGGVFAQAVPSSRADLTYSFSSVVKRAAPAVVNVFSRRVVQARNLSPLFNDPFFQQFFGNDFGGGVPQQRVQSSLGSGVILRADGLIVTNNHVIKNSDQITVVLSDRREYPAHVLLADERDRSGRAEDRSGQDDSCRPCALADSDQLEVGDFVLAIGNPFGVGQTVTSGIISALARTQVGISDYGFFIQTDAAINPGNSRRRPGHHGRQARRHQYGHLFPIRRIDRHRLRHPRQYGRQLPRRRAQGRASRPALDRGQRPGRQRRYGRGPGPRSSDRDHRRRSLSRQSRGRRPG